MKRIANIIIGTVLLGVINFEANTGVGDFFNGGATYKVCLHNEVEYARIFYFSSASKCPVYKEDDELVDPNGLIQYHHATGLKSFEPNAEYDARLTADPQGVHDAGDPNCRISSGLIHDPNEGL